MTLLFSNDPLDGPAQEARARLRKAARDERVDPALPVKVRNALQSGGRPGWLGWNAAAALALVVLPGMLFLDEWHEACENEMSGALADSDPMLRIALGDHLSCVLGLRLAGLGTAQRSPVPLPDRRLAQQVAEVIPPGYRTLDLHECRYGKREMLHFVFERERQAVSLLIASRGTGATLGDRVREGRAGRFYLAGRELKFHVVYLVSENARGSSELLDRVAVRLGPHLARLGPRLLSAEDFVRSGVPAPAHTVGQD